MIRDVQGESTLTVEDGEGGESPPAVNRFYRRLMTPNLGARGRMRHYRVVMTQWKNLQLQRRIAEILEEQYDENGEPYE